MILDRLPYPKLPIDGPRDGRETARVVNILADGHGNMVVDVDLSEEASPYTLEHANISEFSWIRPMYDDVQVGIPGDQVVELTWSGDGPALCRLLIMG